ncbi:hypothetical protein Desaci_2497 [Desulfosporosinus acidiphilus SJ4]|uniref:Uncharacterized protein n=1 Tax=Desulfosporosinus acidiphilus (strain DSM 22704 / JCM 16185 / SJ4) TaxID=646529 RepID=I4D6L9_DESAJ|nr:hypothetical protein Desaci_2497 [Desulfosporosinus acidiphilus SJ4]
MRERFDASFYFLDFSYHEEGIINKTKIEFRVVQETLMKISV